MGRYWYVISVDSGQYSCHGKLAETIFNGEASVLPFMIVTPSYKSFRFRFQLPLDRWNHENSKNYVNSLLSLP